MSYLSKGRSFAVAKEVSYAATAPTFIDGDYVDYTKGDMTSNIASINRAVVRNSMLKLEAVLGQETSSGSIDVEISAAVAGVVNGDKLYENAIGIKKPQATATTVSAVTTTSSFTVTSATGMNVGQVLKVTTGTTISFVAIDSITGSVITVVPALSVLPVVADPVQAMTTYLLPRPNDTVGSLAIRENAKSQANTAINFEYLGVMVTDLSLTYGVGAIATAAFSLGGAGTTTTTGASIPTLPCAIATPIIGKNAVFKVGATNYTAKDLSIKIGSTIADINALTTDGLSNKLITENSVTGSFKLEFTGTEVTDLYKNGTKGILSLFLKDGGKTSGVIHGIIAPSVKLTKVTRSEDAGIMYDSVEFQILSPDCGTTEKAISVFFA